MNSIRCLAIALLVPVSAQFQTPEDLGYLRTATGVEWISTTPWQLSDPEWGCVHRMDREWRVAVHPRSKKLQVTEGPFSHAARAMHEIQFDRGKLLGTNAGEFGGDVRWVTRNKDTTVLVGDNLIQFLARGDSVYALTGLAHMTSSTGELWRLSHRNRVWQVERIVDLKDTPQTAMLEANQITIVGLHRLTTVSLPDTQASSWDYGGWYGSYANSVVRVDNGALYIGLRQGVARLVPTRNGYDAVWFVPRASADSLSEGCN